MSSSRHELVLVRHGETEWSQTGRHTSFTDLPLVPIGRERAARLAEPLSHWSFARVVCSPLRRARETCALAGFGDRAETLEDLREWNYGQYEGLTTPEIRARRPDWWLWRDGCAGGESPADVQRRAQAVLDSARSAGGNVLMFAHGHILRVVASCWIEFDVTAGGRLALSPGSTSVLAHERETAVIGRWNTTT